MLHILNGDAVLHSIRQAGLPGEFAVWGDVLWEGPLLRDHTRAEQREARARYFAEPGDDPRALLRMVERWDQALEQAPAHEEVVIWLEHDLHDQLLLFHHLDRFTRQPHSGLRLICIGEFPGVVPFHGLGQLTPAQLAGLFPTRQAVTPAQLALGQAAWDALTAPSPRALERILAQDTTALPWLAGAIHRLFEEYPEVGTGLSRTERMILEQLREGPATAVDLFLGAQRREERVFMGDSSFQRILSGLATGAQPLVSLLPGAGENRQPLRGRAELTTAGRAVLEGRGDRIELLGIDRWLGGVHLHGPPVPWRWDPAAARLQAAGA